MNEAEVCVWSEDTDNYEGNYDTACGESIVMDDNSAELKKWCRYCCFCGKPVEVWIDGRRQ